MPGSAKPRGGSPRKNKAKGRPPKKRARVEEGYDDSNELGDEYTEYRESQGRKSDLPDIDLLPDPSDGRLLCPQADCGRSASSRPEMVRHLAGQHAVKLCHHCPRQFPSVGSLESHAAAAHPGAPTLLCPRCPELLSDVDEYTSHVRAHLTQGKLGYEESGEEGGGGRLKCPQEGCSYTHGEASAVEAHLR